MECTGSLSERQRGESGPLPTPGYANPSTAVWIWKSNDQTEPERFPSSLFPISDFSLISSLFPIPLHDFFPQLCYWLCHLVLVPKRWTQLWFATRGFKVGAWHDGCWFQNNLCCTVVTHFASDGHRDHSSMCLQLSVVLSKICNLQGKHEGALQ